MVTRLRAAKDGDIIAARLGEDATVKTLTHRGAAMVLEPANDAERAIEVGAAGRLRDARRGLRRVPSVLGAGAARRPSWWTSGADGADVELIVASICHPERSEGSTFCCS